jgi:hypothetical protein
MTVYFQETDSKVVFTLPRELSIPFKIRPVNETTGSALKVLYFPFPRESGLFNNAWRVVQQINDEEVARNAQNILTMIEEMVVSFQQSRFDLSNLPPLHAFRADDGSVLLEWIFVDYRVGFSIEPNPVESGWYLVSNRNLGEISASGYLTGVDTKNLITWLLSFIFSNS